MQGNAEQRNFRYVNVIVAGKQPALQYLDTEAAVRHCAAGMGIWVHKPQPKHL